MIKVSRFYGLGLSLLTIGAFAACSSSGDDDDTSGNTAGNTSHAGTASVAGNTGAGGTGNGTAGTGNSTAGTGTAGTGNGTAGTGTAGTTGTAGAGGGSSTACAAMKPAGALITEFADLTANPTNAGQFLFMAGVPGGTFAYQKGEFVLSDMGKALNAKGKVMNYDGFGVYTTACMDASAYTGVSFSIKGNVGTTGMLNFRVQTNADMAVDTVNKKGSCAVPPGTTDTYPLCHPSSKDIAVTADAKTIEVKFADLMGGVPVAAVDAKDIVGFEWAFTWTAGGTAYDIDVTLDDLKFTGGTPAGGSGGTGGSGGSGGGGAGGGGTGGTGGNP